MSLFAVTLFGELKFKTTKSLTTRNRKMQQSCIKSLARLGFSGAKTLTHL